MIVTPAPVCLLIFLFELGEIFIFVMILFCPHTIRPILMTIPLMIVIVLFVVIGARGVVILGSQRCWRHHWSYKGGAQQDRLP